ncbi:hypothetical protein STEG23_034609 [Scotinomys teguina]
MLRRGCSQVRYKQWWQDYGDESCCSEVPVASHLVDVCCAAATWDKWFTAACSENSHQEHHATRNHRQSNYNDYRKELTIQRKLSNIYPILWYYHNPDGIIIVESHLLFKDFKAIVYITAMNMAEQVTSGVRHNLRFMARSGIAKLYDWCQMDDSIPMSLEEKKVQGLESKASSGLERTE